MVHPALFVGLGAASSIFLSSYGAVVASCQAGVLAVRCGAKTPSETFRSFAPIIISGVLGLYGIIVAIILSPIMQADNLTEIDGYKCLCAGLAVGLACACSGFGIANFIECSMYGGAYASIQRFYGSIPKLGASLQSPLLTSSDPASYGAMSKTMNTNLTAGVSVEDSLRTSSSSAPAPSNGTVVPPSWKFLLVLVFLEAIGLYGLIVALLLSS